MQLKQIISNLINKFGYQVSKLPPDSSSIFRSQIHNNRLHFLGANNKELQIFIRDGSSDFDVFDQVFLKGEYKFLVELISQYKAKDGRQITIIDAGANVGFTSLFFYNILEDVKIISIEPEIKNFNQCNLHVSANRADKILPIHAAVWSDFSELQIDHQFRDSKDWSTSVRPVIERGLTEKLEGYPLTYFIDKFFGEQVDLIKMDIEGAEKELFQSESLAQKFLARTTFICIEIHDEVADRHLIKNILNKSGFILFESGELTIGVKCK